MPENRRADWPGHEPDGIHAERLERADEVISAREYGKLRKTRPVTVL